MTSMSICCVRVGQDTKVARAAPVTPQYATQDALAVLLCCERVNGQARSGQVAMHCYRGRTHDGSMSGKQIEGGDWQWE